MVTRRIRVPVAQVLKSNKSDQWTLQPVQITLLGIGAALTKQLAGDPMLVHHISPEQFEEFICDRLSAMGLEPRRVGRANRKDGGIDIIFWPKRPAVFSFLGAAQLKHHRAPSTKQGPSDIRDFAGALVGHQFNAGIFVTNTTFSPDAKWFAREHAKLIRCRDFTDLRRWMFNIFDDDAEWREVPHSIQLCQGVIVPIAT